MSLSPKVSIIIPSFNRANLIERALRSVLAQTYDNWEIIIVDDGSTDDTAQILARHLAHPSISFFAHPHSGKPSVVRNYGLHQASGDLVCFLDSDDYWAPDSLLMRVQAFSNRSALFFVCSDWFSIDANSSALSPMPSWISAKDIISKIPRSFISASTGSIVYFNTGVVNYLFAHQYVHTSTVMVKREVFDKVGLFDTTLTISEDTDLWLRVCSRFNSAFLNKPLTYVLRHNSNLTDSDFMFNVAQDIQVIETFIDRNNSLSGPYNSLVRKYLARCYYRAGMSYWYHNMFLKARLFLRKAAALRSHNILTYLYLLCTYLPGKLVYSIKLIKNRL